MAKYLIDHGANVNVRDNIGLSPLLSAAASKPPNQIDLVKLLIENGADTKVVDINNDSVLTMGRENNDEVIDVLSKSEIKFNDEWAFYLAVSEGKYTLVKKLIDDGVNISATYSDGGTVLFSAATHGFENIVKLLLESGININATDNLKHTALHRAAFANEVGVAGVLIKKGVDINCKGIAGWTALHVSAQRGSKDVADLLIRSNAKLHALDIWGLTPLKNAENQGHAEEFISALRKTNKSVAYDRTQDDIGALLEAVAEGQIKFVRNVIANLSIDSLYDGADRKTPLIIAAETGREKMVDFLIEHSADVNLANPNGVTPLHAAVINGHEKISKILIENRAQPNVRDKFGITPLMRAAEFNRMEIAKLLLEHGAHKSDTDYNDSTAAARAYAEGHKKLGDLITNWGQISYLNIN